MMMKNKKKKTKKKKRIWREGFGEKQDQNPSKIAWNCLLFSQT